MTIPLVRRQVDSINGGEFQSQTDFFQAKNYLINSNFDIWQRGTTFSTPATGAYNSDRFSHIYDGSGSTFAISQQPFTLGGTAPVPNEPTFFHRIAVTVAGTGGSFRYHRQAIESVRSLAGKTASYSFWAKADAARSVTVQFVQNFGTGGSPSANVTTVGGTFSLTTAWQQFTGSVTIPSLSGKTLGSNGNDYLDFRLQLPINTAMTVDTAQIMVNEGTAVGPWRAAGNHIGHELQLCQRYYQTFGRGTVGFADGGGSVVEFALRFPVVMRGVPTLGLYPGVSSVTAIFYPTSGQVHGTSASPTYSPGAEDAVDGSARGQITGFSGPSGGWPAVLEQNNTLQADAEF